MKEGHYPIRELFDTLQGEGGRAGERSVFIRFAGCNLWNGNPDSRDKGAGRCALWCDTDFQPAKAQVMSAAEIVAKVNELWPEQEGELRWVVLTGGEPALFLDRILFNALQEADIAIAIETNGTVNNPLLTFCDWLTVSPKPPMSLKDEDFRMELVGADELKVVLPGSPDGNGADHWWTEERLLALEESGDWAHLYVQPGDAIDPRFVEVTALRSNVDAVKAAHTVSLYVRHVQSCIGWVKKHPRWRLGLQTHKFAGLR